MVVLLFVLLVCAWGSSGPGLLPAAFNTSFALTLPGPGGPGRAWWAYDAAAGGQRVWHPACLLGTRNATRGCSLVFAGGLLRPVIYAVWQTGPLAPDAAACCVLAKNVPIIPRDHFSHYHYVINTTILHASRGSLQVEMFRNANRQVYTLGSEMVRILDVTAAWDLPPQSQWQLGPQSPLLFQVGSACHNAGACQM